MKVITETEIEGSFLKEVEQESGQKIRSCNQCGKCTAGCPLSSFMEHLPHQIPRLVQMGLRKEALASPSIWICASCHTCGARCPRDIDISEVSDALRQIARREKTRSPETAIPLFHEIFLRRIMEDGRLNEVKLIAELNLRRGNPFQDILLGMKMFLKGKLNLFAPRAEIIEGLKKYWKRVENSLKVY